MNKNIVRLMAGVALVALMASQGMAEDLVSEDTTVYAGGSPDFDESAGGVVIDEPQPVDLGGEEVMIEPDPVDGGLVDAGDGSGGEDPCIDCNTVIGDGDGSEGSPITVEDAGTDVAPTRGGVAEFGGASPEVLRGDTGKSPARVQAESNASEDNAACIQRVGRSQAHRCMN